MWPWIKRWRDWAMHDLWPMHRIGLQPQALHYSYEKAGLTLHDPAIPWNAEAVVVEAQLRLPEPARRKTDFQLRLPGLGCVPAENLRRDEDDGRYRLFFRFPPPGHTVPAELLHQHRSLGQVTLPVLGREEFIHGLRLLLPTVFVRLGGQTVACQTFVSTQCKGLLASAVLTSATSLVPLLDLHLHVEVRSERGGTVCQAPVQLSGTQLGGRQTLLTVVPPRFPRRQGAWVITWLLGDRALASQRVRGISQRHFLRSLRVSDTRFVVQTGKGGVCLRPQMPPLDSVKRLGPCFLVGSREVGMAGLCPLQVRAVVAGAVQPPLLYDQETLVSDGPTVVAPGTLDAAELGPVSAFELRAKDVQVGLLSLAPAPAASFTSEGGFKPPEEFLWSAAADEELTERLSRLLEGPAGAS